MATETPVYNVRPLLPGDREDFLQLLSNFCRMEIKLTPEEFRERLEIPNRFTYVVEHIATKKVVAHGSLFLLRKIHYDRCIGQIEDVVVSPDLRGKGVGKILIKILTQISEEKNCYKTVLNCTDEVRGFYERCDYVRSGNQMRVSHTK